MRLIEPGAVLVSMEPSLPYQRISKSTSCLALDKYSQTIFIKFGVFLLIFIE